MSPWLFFAVFNVIILILVAMDFALLSTNASLKKALILTIVWILFGVSFSICIYLLLGKECFYEYLTAYCVEKSLSIDNVFVFLLIFRELSIQPQYQRKLLFIGLWSALVLRIVMIWSVSCLLTNFSFMGYIFGVLILYAGISSFTNRKGKSFGDTVTKWIKALPNVYSGDHKGRLFIVVNGKCKITIVVVTIFCIEICDIIFAFDSIPALFSITDNKLIIYTSNAFAIIGLRSLYISFAAAVEKFHHLKYGVGAILCFIGTRMIFPCYLHINSATSLWIIVVILLVSFLSSIYHKTP